MAEPDISDIPVTERLSLKGKSFLITGGARGIGFGVAKSIAQLGGSIAILDAAPEPIPEFHALSAKYNIKTSYHQADITIQASLESAFAASVSAMGGQLNGCFTAAGICIDEPLISASWEASMRTLQINVMGTFWTAKLVAKHLVETKTAGSMVFVASTSAQGLHMPVQAVTIYNASKAAVKGMVGPLAVELGPYNIRVNSISPGFIVTPMTAALEELNPPIVNFYRDGAPVGRLGRPQDLSPMVCYLLSDAGSYSTGEDHIISGGIHAGRLREVYNIPGYKG